MNRVEGEPKAHDADPTRPSGRGEGPLRLSEFDWSGFVGENFSLSVLAGAIGAGVGLTVIDQDALPGWVVFSLPLTILSFALALVRVWKTIREERETSALWGRLVPGVSPRGAKMDNVKDAVFEVPYLFSVLILPFSVVLFPSFAACLVVFYAADNYYNLSLVRRLGTDACVRLPNALRPMGALGHRVGRVAGSHFAIASGLALLGTALETSVPIVDPAANSIDRIVLIRFFGRRARLNAFAIWLLLGALAVDVLLALSGRREWALLVSVSAVAALLVMELLVEPFRVLGVQYESGETEGGDRVGEPLLWTVPAGARLDDESVAALKAIHEDAFPPAERQYDIDFMLRNTGRGGYLLLLLTEHPASAKGDAIAGYIFLEARPQVEVVFLWYLAIDKDRRGRGLGRQMVRLALDVVHDRWPSIRAGFLETDSPAPDAPEGAPEMRRVGFYREIGFSWVRDLDYEIPAADDPRRSLRYDPMYVPLRGRSEDLEGPFVRDALLEMARDNFDNRPGDPRWMDLVKSTSRMRRIPPQSPKDA